MKRCTMVAVTLAALTVSLDAFAKGKLGVDTKSGKLVVDLDSAPTDATCFKATGSGKQYELLKSTNECLKDLDQIEEVTLTRQGTKFLIAKDEVRVHAVVSNVGTKTAPELANLPIGDVGSLAPFVLGLDGNRVVKATKVELASSSAPAPTEVNVAACDWAEEHTSIDKQSDVMRIDLTTASTYSAPARSVVAQNRGLIVVVCHAPKEVITAEWGGTRGLSVPATNDQSNGKTQSTSGGPPKPEVVKPVFTTFRFAPRQAGSADVKVYRGSGDNKVLAKTQELEVDKLYWGAIRFGLGTAFGEWRNYEIVTASGSRQAEISEERPVVAFELVTGFAPYLFDLPRGGRSQTGGSNAYVAPYIGFGVLGAQGSGLQALSSVHFGVELEVAPSFSVAANFIMRRTQGLTGDYKAGSPVAGGVTVDGVTSDDWKPGFAIVVNASPSFLQFATGGTEKKAPANDDTTTKPKEPADSGGAKTPAQGGAAGEQPAEKPTPEKPAPEKPAPEKPAGEKPAADKVAPAKPAAGAAPAKAPTEKPAAKTEPQKKPADTPGKAAIDGGAK